MKSKASLVERVKTKMVLKLHSYRNSKVVTKKKANDVMVVDQYLTSVILSERMEKCEISLNRKVKKEHQLKCNLWASVFIKCYKESTVNNDKGSPWEKTRQVVWPIRKPLWTPQRASEIILIRLWTKNKCSKGKIDYPVFNKNFRITPVGKTH